MISSKACLLDYIPSDESSDVTAVFEYLLSLWPVN